jgi:hypothetical protein
LLLVAACASSRWEEEPFQAGASQKEAGMDLVNDNFNQYRMKQGL